MSDNTARILHDVGLAAWFGGSLMGAIGLNGAASQATDEAERPRLAAVGWARWAPINTVAIGAHVIGGVGLTVANRSRIVSQSGVATVAGLKTALTLAAVATTAYSGHLGKRVLAAGRAPADGSTEPGAATPPDVAAAQRQLRVLQMTTPVLTGAAMVITAVMGEQQRPSSVVSGLVARLTPG